jgi:hypothetical protein
LSGIAPIGRASRGAAPFEALPAIRVNRPHGDARSANAFAVTPTAERRSPGGDARNSIDVAWIPHQLTSHGER